MEIARHRRTYDRGQMILNPIRLIRAQRLRTDGTWRDTVVFALTADEWPTAAKRLRARLAAGPTKEPAMR